MEGQRVPGGPRSLGNVVSCEPIETAIPKIDPPAEITPHRRVFNGGPGDGKRARGGGTKRSLTTGLTHSHHVPRVSCLLPPPPLLRQQFFFDASSRFLSDPSSFGLLTLCGEGLHNDGYRVMRERNRKGKKWRLFGCGEDGRHGELMVIINLIYR